MKWISVKDRLPDAYTFVLVCANFQGTGEPKPINISRFALTKWEFLSGHEEVGAWSDIEYGMDINDITHWMPLPKSPEKE